MTAANQIEKLPEGWRRVRLGGIADINMGQSPPSIVVNERGLGIPFLQGNAEFTSKYPVPQKWVTKPLKLSKKGDILISVRAPVGAVNKADRDYCIGRGLAAISFRATDDSFGWFGIIYWKYQLENLSQGSTFGAISRDDLKNLLLLLPSSPSEQRKIAEILETVDNAIEKTGRIIEKYKRIKQGLMQDLLTRGIAESDELGVRSYELRDEKKHRFKDSPLGRIPEEWEVVELGCVGDIIYGEGLRQELYEPDGDTLVFGTGGIIGRAKLFLDRGPALVIPRKGSITSVFYIQEDQKFWIIDTAFYLKPQNGYCKFIYFTLCNMDLELLNEATGVPSLSRENIKSIQIPLPPLPEQKRIASILSQIDEVIEKEQKYKEKLERIKRGLMEDLLTGKVRVNELIDGEKNIDKQN